ncbi:MAG: 2-methylisocitrate lyase-like PEP mutase family enzyme [Candidatus Azotimanducaceae bacterium]|jgi:2-methylisocitrate lyase-like PEP mutase family enzyme
MSLVLQKKRESALVAPLTLDPLSAHIAQAAGFEVGYVSGGALGYAYGVSEALLTVTELAEVVRRITNQTDMDVIADIGVGFGDPVHVARTTVEMESAGACAVEIEDQVAPKRVSHHRGIEHLVDVTSMCDKIKVICDTRVNDSMLVIARTGAVKNESFVAALERLERYAEAGADILMLMPEDAQQCAQARSQFDLPLATITAMDQAQAPKWQGWDLIIDPFTAQVLAVTAVQNAYQRYVKTGETGVDLRELFDAYHELDTLAGLEPLYTIEDWTTERQ